VTRINQRSSEPTLLTQQTFASADQDVEVGYVACSSVLSADPWELPSRSAFNAMRACLAAFWLPAFSISSSAQIKYCRAAWASARLPVIKDCSSEFCSIRQFKSEQSVAMKERPSRRSSGRSQFRTFVRSAVSGHRVTQAVALTVPAEFWLRQTTRANRPLISAVGSTLENVLSWGQTGSDWPTFETALLTH
jgi:hypothetical protein